MGMFSFVSKWNKAGELFRTRQFILTFAKEEDLVKIEEVIKKRREELAKKEPNQQSPYGIIFVARSFMGGGCLLEMGGFQWTILQKGLQPVNVYQALMLMLAFATFVIALLIFIFTFCA